MNLFLAKIAATDPTNDRHLRTRELQISRSITCSRAIVRIPTYLIDRRGFYNMYKGFHEATNDRCFDGLKTDLSTAPAISMLRTLICSTEFLPL